MISPDFQKCGGHVSRPLPVDAHITIPLVVLWSPCLDPYAAMVGEKSESIPTPYNTLSVKLVLTSTSKWC